MTSTIEILSILLVDNLDGTATVTAQVKGELNKGYIPIKAVISNPRIKGGEVTCTFDNKPVEVKINDSLAYELNTKILIGKEVIGEDEEFDIETTNHNKVRQIKEKAIRRLRHTSRSKGLKAYLG